MFASAREMDLNSCAQVFWLFPLWSYTQEYHWMPKGFQSVENEKNLSPCTFKINMQKATTNYEVTCAYLIYISIKA